MSADPVTPVRAEACALSALPRLLVIGPTPPPYHGVAVATEALLNARWRERFEVAHLDLADRRGIQHVDRPDLHDLWLFIRQWLRLVVMLVRYRPRLVYVPISQSSVGFVRDSLFIWPALWTGSRLVLHLHGGNFRSWYEGRAGIARAYVRAVLRRVARVIVLGETLKTLFHGLVPEERIVVVPNGVKWQASEGTACRTSGGRYRVLYLGTLNRQKGALWLLEAAALVVRSRADIEFVFAGPWSSEGDKREAAAAIARHGIGCSVIFTGAVAGAAKQALFGSADLFVFPGLQQEGQPLVVIEALAAGIPVLYTARGCLRDTVLDGEQGLEVSIGDVRQLADKILWMAGNPADAARMGRNARHRYEACFTDEHFSRNLGQVLARVAEERS